MSEPVGENFEVDTNNQKHADTEKEATSEEYQQEVTEFNEDRESPRTIKRRQMTLPLMSSINKSASANTTPAITTTASDGPPSLDNCAMMRKIFKTKRFYESEDDKFMMKHVFSDTIRSTSATPTDDLEINKVVGFADLSSFSSSGTTKKSFSSIKMDDSDISRTPNVSPINESSSLNLDSLHHQDNDNHSIADQSSAESQTDNIEMYNEPNLQSLIDNVADEQISITYMNDQDSLPLDGAAFRSSGDIPQHHGGTLVSTPSIVLECYNDDLVKTEEYELESSHDHYSPPILKQVPRRPLEGVSFFDTTIEEEEEYYDADVDSESYGGSNDGHRKGTNTFDCKSIRPIKEAARYHSALSRGGASDDESTESVKTDILESDPNEPDSDETFKADHSAATAYQQDNSDHQQDSNMHASQSSMQQQHTESESRTTVTTKKLTTKKIRSSSARTSSTTTSTALESFSNSTDIVQSENVAALTSDTSSKLEKSAIKKRSDSLTGKKKSKKSKKSDPEKENISVKNIYLMAQPPLNWRPTEQQNRTVAINRAVSVKHLCRSFGDLTVIAGEKNRMDDSSLKRAKSVGDMRRSEIIRPIQTGVSVKALRDSYCSLVGLGSATNDNKSAQSGNKKSSFSKFDALQKKNILRVRSSDAGKAQEKFSDANVEVEKNCKSCGKVVYKMEEIKAEKNIWHRNCFRCHECGKSLNVDTYQSHESVLYCKQHFKLLLAPKPVDDNEPLKPRKPELIIRENQPVELPPDVIRASDKPDLGLEELQQLNVKSRFEVFENYQEQSEQKLASLDRSPSGVKRSASILSKLAKFQAKGMNTGVSDSALNDVPYEQSSSEDEDEDIEQGDDADLIRAKRAQRERPISFSNMNDIKTKFEKGHIMTKEERREECKQEIQNIRSRLFMGKQARIKEMYQQAVAESEQGITSTSKKPEIEIGDKAKTLKEKFERGEISNREDDEIESTNLKVAQDEEMAVFEQGIGKKSRSIFMELDASVSKSPQSLTPMPPTPRTPDAKKLSQVSPLQSDKLKPFITDNVVKYDEKPDDIKIETSEISSKFKFFETYKPNENKRKEFRITPPREGVVKMPSPEREVYIDPTVVRSEEITDDPTVAEQSHTTTKMLSVFRQMEQKKRQEQSEVGLKPLKRFTPPPDENRRVYSNESEEDLSGTEGEEEEEEEEMGEEEESETENRTTTRYDDEFLKQAQSAARAKQLRAKFEKWEANEIRRELSNGAINIYDQVENTDEGQIETAKSLRAKFESMKETTSNSAARPRIQVNRFV